MAKKVFKRRNYHRYEDGSVRVGGQVISGGSSGEPIEVDELPDGSEDNIGKIYKLTSTGSLYRCKYAKDPLYTWTVNNGSNILWINVKDYKDLKVGDKAYGYGQYGPASTTYTLSAIDGNTYTFDTSLVVTFYKRVSEGDILSYEFEFLNGELLCYGSVNGDVAFVYKGAVVGDKCVFVSIKDAGFVINETITAISDSEIKVNGGGLVSYTMSRNSTYDITL